MNEQFINECKNGNFTEVERLLKDPRVDPSARDNESIKHASVCMYGRHRLEVVKLLLKDPRVDPSADDNWSIRIVCMYGGLEVFSLLLKDPRVDPSADDNTPIRWASSNGHLEIVRILLKDSRVDPSARDNYAIKGASVNGHDEVISLLLKDPRVDPSAEDNWSIRKVSKNGGYLELIELLLKDSRTNIYKLQEQIKQEEYPRLFQIIKDRIKLINNSATIIQNGCHNWLWKPKCDDGTVGIQCRLMVKDIEGLQ
jgi:ankyrin repeat protein